MTAPPAPPPSYPLDSTLPPQVLIGGNTVWSRYRQFPVFSGPWLRGRTVLFASVIAFFSAVTAFAVGFSARDYGVGALSGLHLLGAFTLMATAGPALATWVRYRRWPAARERRAVVLAVLVGVALSFLADFWASSYVEGVVEAAYRDNGQPLPDMAAEAPMAERVVAVAINLAVLVLIYGLFGGGLALRAYFSEQRRWLDNHHAQEVAQLRELKQHSDLRLGVLQAQVEPHFLFNTLASVRALVRQDPAQAEATLDALVEHLRSTIPQLRDDGDGLVHSTLGQQLDICASYLELMRLRMGGRLDFTIEADDALRARPYPPLLLITLVENAIKHGIEPKHGPGRVVVRALEDADHLNVAVIDDGVGLQPGLGSGVGLANVREQLLERYGGRAALHMRSAPGKGVEAEIRLPLEAPARSSATSDRATPA
ncbi:sensor histidine kinase [Lysobacter sp. A3-1-A15]|uniref:sensor histidine kinase n=1 Tax=Novilysobacter viscosus TaxID=3098602 RepID=UPI002ED8ACE8